MFKSPISRFFLMLFSIFALSACATQVTENPSQVTKSKVPFSQFDKVVLVKAELKGEYAGQGANIKAANKIDEVLAAQLGMQFNNLSLMTLEEAKQKYPNNQSSENVLIVRPLIKQIKFIGGAARFFAGAMAGSSVVVMDTAFIDAKTGDVIANPGYYRKAGAYSDAFGVASNVMLEDIARDVGNYTRSNM